LAKSHFGKNLFEKTCFALFMTQSCMKHCKNAKKILFVTYFCIYCIVQTNLKFKNWEKSEMRTKVPKLGECISKIPFWKKLFEKNCFAHFMTQSCMTYCKNAKKLLFVTYFCIYCIVQTNLKFKKSEMRAKVPKLGRCICRKTPLGNSLFEKLIAKNGVL